MFCRNGVVMLSEQLLMEYMVAHVSMNTNTDISRWTANQVVRAFATLPMPAISPEDWAVRVYGRDAVPVDNSRKSAELGGKLWGWAMSRTKIKEPEPEQEPEPCQSST